MEEKGRWKGMSTDPVFSLWRILDHTRFMIARSREKELAEYGLTPEQSFVLDILQESNGSTTINQLVEITQRQHHSISTLIDRMTKQGLVNKRKGVSDRRKYEVIITQKGKKLIREMTRESVGVIFSSLSEDDRAKLKSYLIEVMKGAYEVLGKEPQQGFLRPRLEPSEEIESTT